MPAVGEVEAEADAVVAGQKDREIALGEFGGDLGAQLRRLPAVQRSEARSEARQPGGQRVSGGMEGREDDAGFALFYDLTYETQAQLQLWSGRLLGEDGQRPTMRRDGGHAQG